jgi:putative hydrolase of HD superfamily
MPQPTHADIDKLLRTLVLPFYHIKRDNPVPVGERRWENDAEHSWSLAILACSLAGEIDPELDIGKVCQFATVHDLVEIYAGDTSVFAANKDLNSKADRERAALKIITKEFAHFPWIARTITAYEHKDSQEALFVYALDKYIGCVYDHMDEAKLFRERKVTLADYNKVLEPHRTKAHSHPGVAEYYDEVRRLLDQHPEYFHQENYVTSL